MFLLRLKSQLGRRQKSSFCEKRRVTLNNALFSPNSGWSRTFSEEKITAFLKLIKLVDYYKRRSDDYCGESDQ